MRRQRRKAEEHEERMLTLNRRVRDDLPLTSAEHAAWKEWACRPPSSAGKRRKRKKRRKKKTPKASSSRGRARRRHRQRHFCGAGSTYFAPFRNVFGRLVMLGIMAGMEQKGFFKFVDIPYVLQTQILMVQTIQQTTEFPQLLNVSGGRCPCCAGRSCHAALVSTTADCAHGWFCWLRCASAVFLLIFGIMAGIFQKDSCCGMYEAGCAGCAAPRAVLSSSLAGPRCSASWPVWSRWTVMRLAVACTRLVLLVILHFALCFLPCCQAQDACRRSRRQVRIMAGMNHKDIYTVGGFFWYRTLRFVPFLLSSGPGCSHHGRYGPEGGLRRAVHQGRLHCC